MNTQEKQELNTKIEELKKTIAELEAKVNGPEEQPWIPHGNYWVTDFYLVDREVGVSCDRFVSKQAAQYAAEKLKPIYKLLSYVTEFDKDEYGKKSYLIRKYNNKFDCLKSHVDEEYVDVVYMSKQCAEELVDKLNKDLVKLD